MPSPFERLFDPSNPSRSAASNILGTIGRMAGVPTAGERAGGARGQALQMMSQSIAQGKTPQQALTELMRTPEGVNLFASDPQLLDTLGTFMQQQAGPAPHNVPQGAAAINPQTGQVIHSQPTTDVQRFNHLAEIAQLPPEAKREFAMIMMLPPEQQTEKARALNRLVSQGLMTEQTRDSILGGVGPQKIPLQNSFGDTVGHIMFDPGTGQAMHIPGVTDVLPTQQPGQAPGQPGQPTQPGQPRGPQEMMQPQRPQVNVPPQEHGEATPLQDTDAQILEDPKASMALVAGLFPYITSLGGGVLRQGGLNVNTRRTDERFAALNQLNSSLTGLMREGGGMNIPSRVVSVVQDLTRFGSLGSLTRDASKANSLLLSLRRNLEEELPIDEAAMNDIRQPRQVRQDAARRIQTYQRILRQMPTLPQIERVQTMIENGGVTSPAEDFTGFINQALQDRQRATGELTRGLQQMEEVLKNPTALTVERINRMTPEQIGQLDPKTLSPAQSRAIVQRLRALQQQQQQRR